MSRGPVRPIDAKRIVRSKGLSATIPKPKPPKQPRGKIERLTVEEYFARLAEEIARADREKLKIELFPLDVGADAEATQRYLSPKDDILNFYDLIEGRLAPVFYKGPCGFLNEETFFMVREYLAALIAGLCGFFRFLDFGIGVKKKVAKLEKKLNEARACFDGLCGLGMYVWNPEIVLFREKFTTLVDDHSGIFRSIFKESSSLESRFPKPGRGTNRLQRRISESLFSLFELLSQESAVIKGETLDRERVYELMEAIIEVAGIPDNIVPGKLGFPRTRAAIESRLADSGLLSVKR